MDGERSLALQLRREILVKSLGFESIAFFVPLSWFVFFFNSNFVLPRVIKVALRLACIMYRIHICLNTMQYVYA